MIREGNMSEMVCEKCGSEMVLRNGKYGQFWGCSGYPKCRNTKPHNGNGKPKAEVVDARPEKTVEPSLYQMAAFDWIRTGTGNAVMDAKAGSGKSWTLRKGLAYTDSSLDIAYVAFNKRIADAAASIVPSWVNTSTMHSLGLGNCKN